MNLRRNGDVGPWMGRTPHSDPRIETRLQQIISLMESVSRWKLLIATCREAIASAHASMQKSENSLRDYDADRDALQAAITSAQERETRAFDQIKEAEQQIEATQGEISDLVAALPDVDLAFLYPARRS